jgi:hypothetical protein
MLEAPALDLGFKGGFNLGAASGHTRGTRTHKQSVLHLFESRLLIGRNLQ